MRTFASTAIAAAIYLSVAQAPAATAPAAAAGSAPIPVADFLRDDHFEEVKISPTGDYVATSVNITDGTDTKRVLVVQQRTDGKVLGHFNLLGKTEVQDFWWVNDKRVLISVGEKFGLLEKPQATGELYGMNFDGSGQGILIGARAIDNGNATDSGMRGTLIKTGKRTEANAAFMVDDLPDDANHVIVSVWPSGTGANGFAKAERMDVNSGETTVLASAPVKKAEFETDLQGNVRFAVGSGDDNESKTYYRDGPNAAWVLLNDEAATKIVVTPLGFAADGRTAYLRKEDSGQGPDAVVAYDTTTHAMREVLRDAVADPERVVRGPHHEALGVRYLDARPRVAFFDENNDYAKAFRTLEASFPDQAVVFSGYAKDGKIALVYTYSDRSPGDYYLFDIEHKKAVHALSHRDWIDPDRMGQERPVTLKSRDGRTLHGFVTLPAGSNGKNLPMVVNPHGGPFGIADVWGFDKEAQLLASRGYAVLQVNYRGSGGFGRDFTYSGYRQWGGTMQDDVTDATRWAIEQGIADPKRICIYGASYGAYAALMGAAKEPALYRCAIGYVGVYDLPSMYTVGDVQETHWGKDFWIKTIGQEGLEAHSPTHLADRIQVPVLLAAGKEDRRAPPKHTEMMRDALQKAGKPVDATIYAGEGHGFFVEADRESFYNSLLGFLDRNIGTGAAASH